jgi:4-amino-4-deoxy-L-arabinose transferase-like glycosyltransferase
MPLSVRVLRGLALGFLAFKLVLLATAGLFMDEAYYFVWGQHPALSYFDHPPMVAWVQGLSASLFGWSMLAVRLPVVVTLLATLWVLRLFARRFAGANVEQAFWLSALLYLATPIFFAATGFALPDHLLSLFVLASLYCFISFLDGWRREQGGEWRGLYLGALWLGLALLSKYTAGLLGVALALFLLTNRRYRPLWLSPHLWLAGLLVCLLQAPVLVWNLQNDWASFGFIVGGRQGIGALGDFSGVTGYLLTILVFVSPFLLWPVIAFVIGRGRPEGESPAIGLARIVVIVSSLTWLVASVFTNILFHWNLVAYLAFVPFVWAYLHARWLLSAHCVYAAIAALLAMVNYCIIPILALISQADQTSGWSWGWDEVAARVRIEQQAHGAAFVAGSDYALAAPLAFALRDGSVTSLDADTDQFDFWFDANGLSAENAIIVVDRWRPLPAEAQARFARITELGQVEITRLGTPITRYTLLLGESFIPPPPP